MIQDFFEKFDNAYHNFTPSENDKAICFENGEVLAKCNNGVIDFPNALSIGGEATYLFSIDSERFFLCSSQPFDDYKYYNTSIFRTMLPKKYAFAGETAMQLNNWYQDNKYCGRCGSLMTKCTDERAMQCTCSNRVYPKISPAVIVAIISGNKLCLTKYNRPNAHWALVAGFNEIGETIEDTVRREVMEETGLSVKNLVYYKSQPWGFTSTLLYGYFCRVDGDDTITIDNDELKAAQWFSSDEIEFDDDDLSLTREMIDKFKSFRLKNKES